MRSIKGKYDEWLTADGLLTIESWARDGLSKEQIAHNMGINVKTLREWEAKYDPICTAIKKGKRPIDMEVENALLKKALQGDVTAQIFWLKNRKPKQWRDKPVSDEDSEALKAARVLLEGVNSAIN